MELIAANKRDPINYADIVVMMNCLASVKSEDAIRALMEIPVNGATDLIYLRNSRVVAALIVYNHFDDDFSRRVEKWISQTGWDKAYHRMKSCYLECGVKSWVFEEDFFSY
jgi:hypothetical protein